MKDSVEVTVDASAGYLEVVGSAFNQENGLDCENWMWKWCNSGRRQISGEGASEVQKLGVLTVNIQDLLDGDQRSSRSNDGPEDGADAAKSF